MKNKKIKFTLDPLIVCIGILLIGALFVVISFIEFKEPVAWWTAWGKNSVSTLGTTLVGSSVISLILEISNIKNIFSDTMKNVLGDDFPIDAYSEENLNKFNKRIVAHLCDGNVEADKLDNSIYEYEQLLREEIAKPYYKFHNAKYVYTPNSNKGIIKVHADVTYKLENKYQKDNIFEFKIKTYSVSGKGPDEDFSENFKLVKFKINNEDQDVSCVKVEEIDKKTNDGYYDYKIIIRKDLKKEKEVTIEIEYDYNMIISDKTQAFKIRKACKNLEHDFVIKPDEETHEEWMLRASAFSSFFCSHKDFEEKIKIKQTVENTLRIDFGKWILPGSGYVIIMKTKG